MSKVVSILVGLLLISVSFISGAIPASAHADLTGTSPVDGAVLESEPESLTLSFNSRILDGMAEIAVTNSLDELVTGVVAESASTTVTALWPADLPGDTYVVAYRIVSEDGHPITGTFSFNYPDSQTVTAESDVTTVDIPTVEPDQTALEPSVAESANNASTSSDSPSATRSLLVWALGFLALVAVAAGLFRWRRRST
jgi:hypothetical protein